MADNNFPLRTILWETTLRCNAYCEFCGSRCGDVKPENELTAEEICNTFKHIAEKYDATKIMIDVTGGEPLVREDIFDVMSYAVSLGFSWGLVTNGTLITKEIVDKLKNSGMKTISISIDGLADTHNNIRRVKNGFQKIENALHMLHDADFVETVMITTVVSKSNFDELNEVKEYLRTQPIDVWRVCPVDPIGRAYADEQLLLSKEQTTELIEYILKIQNECLPFRVTTSCSHYFGKYETDLRDFPFQCNAGRTVASILANGDIFVCPNVPRVPELIQGNVRKDNFADVWENGFGFFRDSNSRCTGPCKDCSYYTKCKGDSMHTWDFEKGQPKICAKNFDFVQQLDFLSELPEISLKELFDSIKNGRHLFDNLIHRQSLSNDKIVFAPEASEKMLKYFEWGTEERTDERLCGLYGKIYKDSERGKDSDAVITTVKNVIPIEDVVSSENQLLLTPEHIRNAEEQVKNNKELADCIFLGFAHTHPNGLKIAMSQGDFHQHRELYRNNWKEALTVIVNPQKKHIAAYAGPSADNVDLHILSIDSSI